MAEKCSILFQFRVYLGRVEQKERKKMLFRNIKGGNILGNSYKICFLGYRKLREMAQQVIDKLNYQDTTVVMKECAIETLEQVVNEADSEGCQVFVAGSANAEEFKQRFSEHLVELHIDMSDYVYCLCRARDMGARRVGVTIYRKSRQMNFEALQELAGIPIEPIYFERLTYLLEHTSCDCVIGASLTVEVAERLGLPCILIYDGEYTIRTSIERARVLAAELQASSRKEAITDALVRDVPAGIIITDENATALPRSTSRQKLWWACRAASSGAWSWASWFPRSLITRFIRAARSRPTTSTCSMVPWCAVCRLSSSRATARWECSLPCCRTAAAGKRRRIPGNLWPGTSGKTLWAIRWPSPRL